jgi:hypothetical protein
VEDGGGEEAHWQDFAGFAGRAAEKGGQQQQNITFKPPDETIVLDTDVYP